MTKLPNVIRSTTYLAMLLGIAATASAQTTPLLFPTSNSPELIAVTAAAKPTLLNITTDVLRVLGKVNGSPQALRIATPATASPSWNTGIRYRSTAKVSKNDCIQISFMLRSVVDTPTDKRVKIALVDRKNQASRILETTVYNPTTTWKKVEIGVVSWDAYAAGDLLLEFWLGLDKQNFEIANLQVVDNGTTYSQYNLRNTVRYPGSNPNAPWRATAAARIAANRTGTMNIKVVDSNGNAVSGATVRAKMDHNAFEFGSALNAGAVGSTIQSNNMYQKTFLENFNAGVFENDTKWTQYIINGWKEWDGSNNPFLKPAALLLHNQGIHLRGHNLIWPTLGYKAEGYYYMPPDLTKTTPVDTLRSRVNDHFRTLLQDPVLDQVFDEWDVLNEAYDNNDLQGTLAAGDKTAKPGILGNMEMVNWYKMVNQYSPSKETFYNNFSTIEGNDTNRVAYDKALIKYIKQNGGRLDGVGLQSHFVAGSADDPTNLYNELSDWGAQGVRVKITEYDMNADDADGVANFMRDFLITCYSNPNVDGFYVWGFWKNQMYQSRSALWDAGFNPTAAGKAWMDLMSQWKTDVTGTTDTTGSVSLVGHAGTYNITVTKGSVTKTVPLTLTKDGKALTVTLS